jgi:hypothetical protein
LCSIVYEDDFAFREFWGKNFDWDGRRIKGYLCSQHKYVWKGKPLYFISIYDVLYKTKYEDLPISIGEHKILDEIISWRLKRGR